jgi:hypothetical protein
LLTPIQTTKLPYFISDKKYKSFSYTISTVGFSPKHDCMIQLKSINDGYNIYFVDVQTISAQINSTTRQFNDDIILVYAYNWSECGYGGLKDDSSMLVGTIINRSNSLISIDPRGSHSKFIISNMTSIRDIRFKLFRENLTEFPANAITEDFEYSVNCLITPIN